MKTLTRLSIKTDVAFVDEATKGYLYELLPMLLAVTEKVIFIGDHRQLGNIAIPEDAKVAMRKSGLNWDIVENFSEGFFYSVIKSKLLESNLLKINRRSLPKIADLISLTFYGGELISGRFNPFDQGKIILLDTKNLPDNKEKKKKTSYLNPTEKNLAVARFIIMAKKRLVDGGKITDCAIITPYQAQIHAIKKQLRKALLFNPVICQSGQVTTKNIDSILDQLVNTVDAFQGSQRFGIVLSLVRSNDSGDIGFNQDPRRLNVAMSRAQDQLVIICNTQTFLDCYDKGIAEIFSSIVSFVQQNGKYTALTI